MKNIRKALAPLLAVVLVMMFSLQAFAAVSLPAVSSSKPMIAYTISASGKVYAYKAADLKAKTGGYIACATDECKIMKISGNAVQVKYPVGKGTKTAWFARSAFTSCDISKGAADKWTQAKKATIYRRSDGKNSFGSISAGDVCYKLATKGNYTQVIYPVSGGYKMGWMKTGDIDNGKAALYYPLKGSITRSSSVKTNGYYCDYKASSGTPIYAPADGTVKFQQSYSTKYKKLASYGNQILFTSGNGQYTVRCAHLSKFNGVSPKYTSSLSYPCSSSKYACSTVTLKTKTVKKGELLGYTGKTGNASGPHMHLEVKKNGKAVDPAKVFATWK